jgi:hypothetical protein
MQTVINDNIMKIRAAQAKLRSSAATEILVRADVFALDPSSSVADKWQDAHLIEVFKELLRHRT